MPTVEVSINGVSVKIEAHEISPTELCARALATLEKAHEIERKSTEARIAGTNKGGGYL